MLRRTPPSCAAVFSGGGFSKLAATKLRGPVAKEWNLSGLLSGGSSNGSLDGSASTDAPAMSSKKLKSVSNSNDNVNTAGVFAYQRLQRPSAEYLAQLHEQESFSSSSSSSSSMSRRSSATAAAYTNARSSFVLQNERLVENPPSHSGADGYDFVIDTTQLDAVINDGWPVHCSEKYYNELDSGVLRKEQQRPLTVVTVSGAFSKGKSYLIQHIINAGFNRALENASRSVMSNLLWASNKDAVGLPQGAGVTTKGASCKFAQMSVGPDRDETCILLIDMAGRNAPASRQTAAANDVPSPSQRAAEAAAAAAAEEQRRQQQQQSTSPEQKSDRLQSKTTALKESAVAKAVTSWFSKSTALATAASSSSSSSALQTVAGQEMTESASASSPSLSAPASSPSSSLAGSGANSTSNLDKKKKLDDNDDNDDEYDLGSPVPRPHDEADIASMLDAVGLERTKERILDEVALSISNIILVVVDELLSDDQRHILHLIAHAPLTRKLIIVHNFKRLLNNVSEVRALRKHIHGQVVLPFAASPAVSANSGGANTRMMGDAIPRHYTSVWNVPGVASVEDGSTIGNGTSSSSPSLVLNQRTIRRRDDRDDEERKRQQQQEEDNDELARENEDPFSLAKRGGRTRIVNHFVLTKGETEPRLYDTDPNRHTFAAIARLIADTASSGTTSIVTKANAIDVIGVNILEKMCKYGRVEGSSSSSSSTTPAAELVPKIFVNTGAAFAIKLAGCDKIRFANWSNWPTVESTHGEHRVPHRQREFPDGSYVVSFDLAGMSAEDFVEKPHLNPDAVMDFASADDTSNNNNNNNGATKRAKSFFSIEPVRNSHRLLLGLRLYGMRSGEGRFSEMVSLRVPGSHRVSTLPKSDERPHGWTFVKGVLKLKFRPQDEDE